MESRIRHIGSNAMPSSSLLSPPMPSRRGKAARQYILALSCVLLWVMGVGGPASGGVISLDPNTTYQTIVGWGNNYAASQVHPDVPSVVVDEMKQDTIENLGVTWIRMGGPIKTDGSLIDVSGTLVDFKARVEARGDSFHIQGAGHFGPVPQTDPRTYFSSGYYADKIVAEWKLVLDQASSIFPTYFNLVNEPDDVKRAQPSWMVMEHGRELMRRAHAEGLTTMSVSWADSESVDREMRYINEQSNSGIFDDGTVGVLSYHAYGSTNETSWRNQIRDFARSKGLSTAMTENNQGDVYEFVDDLVEGDVSRYLPPHYAKTAVNYVGASRTEFERGPHCWSFRQITHYVRPGAVRIEATSNDSANVKPVAFVQGGRMVVVIPNKSYSSQTVTVSGLSAGEYGLSRSVSNAPSEETGVLNVSGSFQVVIPSRAIATIYPRAAGADLPPQVNVWGASPGYLLTPASSINLSVDAADPELGALTYTWSLVSGPSIASVAIANPSLANTSVSGLSVDGDYHFRITVSDGNATNDRSRTVVLNRSPNAAPRIVEMFTIPSELEVTDTMMLLAGIQDREDQPDMDNPTPAITYQWAFFEKPSGSTVSIDNPTARGATVSNWGVPGDYRVRLRVRDPSANLSTQDSSVIVVHPSNLNAPLIANMSAQAVSASTAMLSADTSDIDGHQITHWWRLVSGPVGASIVFETPDAASTTVSGMTPGDYVFQLSAIDRSKWAQETVAFTMPAISERPTGSWTVR